MTVKLSTGLRQNLLNNKGFKQTFDTGVIYIYSGAQPLTADAAVAGTLLGIVSVNAGAFAFGSPTNGLVFDAPVAGVLSKAVADVWKFNGLVDGVAGWFRLMGNASDNLGSSAVLPRLDGSMGVTGADLNLSNITIAPGSPNTIDIFNYTIPAQ